MPRRPARPRRGRETEIADMARSIFEKVRLIKRTHPQIARQIDTRELEIRQCLQEIRREIDKLDDPDRELVKVLVINGIYRSAEEVLTL